MITKKQYVERLRKMLDEPEPCVTCPGFENFGSYIKGEGVLMKDWVDPDGDDIDDEICEMCADFVGCKTCPCFELKAPEAIRRARLAIEMFDEGQECTFSPQTSTTATPTS